MKTLKVFQVKNLKEIVDRFKMTSAPTADMKAIFKFYGEVTPSTDIIESLIKEALEKLKGETVTETELNKAINDALADELMKDVEITPFTLSEEAQEIIARLSNVTLGEIQMVLAMVAEEKNDSNEDNKE